MAGPPGPPPRDPRSQLAESLWNDPETRPLLEEAVVRKFGDRGKAAIPLYQDREQLAQERAEMRAEREQWRAERQQELAGRALDMERRKILDDPVLRIKPDDIPHVEKLMEEQTIGSHRAAAQLYRQQQQIAAPRGTGFAAEIPGMNGAGGEHFAGIVQNPDAWARKQAEQIIADFAAGRGEKWID